MSGTPASLPHPVRAAALARLPALRDIHPGAFRVMTRLRIVVLLGWLAGTALLFFGLWRLGVEPARLATGLGQMWHFLGLMLPPDPGSWANVRSILQALAETLAIAFLGTFGAAFVALPISLLAARNATIHGIVRFLSRRVLDGIRGVDALIWALIWVGIVGLGPFAGVLAIFTSDVGTLGKVFSEAIEAADRRPQEGVVAAGGSGVARIRFGILPEVVPVLAGQVLYFFESNVRSSTIIGIVGAGGIGLHLAEMIRTLEWPTVSFIVLLILAMVAVIDLVSGRLRRRLMG
ncbi:phosphonate ABC transporter, permease protein PhnE [Siccirubricoccus sp. KC 17139]|uniref:Phosphonate ABC transporter, permease protein PhnE n=1 Tax=Siccirubricoccus soli TaxID=2899147 RepID=A0ABT1D8U4_9PROT|nr:phosphonate ABC transporter, permease protein PhnE [Siccirubricoccus soli]MCO6418338.1 phosphonate ABC transporter, permease protein PhnE [Siccirubricoccus soli]MCP2684473.1 phosphonate ABC transporter, permease protein PhnE [Siccirubricoccus soli]